MIEINEVKRYLNVIHNFDDAKLELILRASIDEALQYCNVDEQESLLDDDGELPSSFKMGVLILCQGAYNVGAENIEKLRHAAETKLHPFRRHIGV